MPSGGILASQRCANLDAQEPWTGLAYILTKEAMGLGRHCEVTFRHWTLGFKIVPLFPRM